jgi:hypothetical protein
MWYTTRNCLLTHDVQKQNLIPANSFPPFSYTELEAALEIVGLFLNSLAPERVVFIHLIAELSGRDREQEI